MNLLCPNCQKPLSVAEQYAGQPMRCPLCAGTFTVPALPAAPPPPAPPPAPPETYGFKDPVAPSPPPPAPAPELRFESTPSAPKAPSSFTGTAPTGPATTYAEEQPTFPSTPAPEGYHRKYTIWFSPRVLQYVAPVCVFVVFVLTFFAWTGVYPGGVPDSWQNAWQAAFAGYSTDPDAASIVPPFPKDGEPGVDFLMIFYVLLLIPTLLITFGCLALAFVPHAKLPPTAHPLLPWRWGVVAALNLILFLFLILQLAFGFSLENNFIAAKDKEVAAHASARKDAATTPQQREDAIERGMARQEVGRTVWLDLVVLFSILAIVGAGLMFWLNRRGARPAPRIDKLW